MTWIDYLQALAGWTLAGLLTIAALGLSAAIVAGIWSGIRGDR